MKHISTFSSFSTFFICLFLTASNLSGQSLIALQHNGNSTFFTQLQDAHAAAANGDTIYVPGGSYSSIQISKSIHLIGVGYYPDSTAATDRSVINEITLLNGSSGGSIEGIFVNLSININAPNEIENFTISRCWIGDFICSGSFCTNGGKLTRSLIKENFARGIYLAPGYFNIVANNICGSIIVEGGLISNNVIFDLGSAGFHSSEVKNNIFKNTAAGWNSIYKNNINSGVNGVDMQGNQGSGNIYPSSSFESLFVNVSNGSQMTLNFNDDFHLTTNYLGTDGTPVGIYGGLYPWKAGGVPYNPHIRTKNIATSTNAQGLLNIQVKVAAQGN